MSTIDILIKSMEFNRGRTLTTLEAIEKLPQPQAVLAWRPNPGRAHIGWQLMHIGITEELFATERLLGTTPGLPDLLPRFRGGSTPDDSIPEVETIRAVLKETRDHLRTTFSTLTEGDLGRIPSALKERGLTISKVLQILGWHEAHHQGQSHITLNLYKAAHA